MTQRLYMFVDVIAFVHVLGVLHCIKAQGLINSMCGPDTFTPQIPHIFYLGNTDFRVCPPVGTVQDAVVCILKMAGSLDNGYSVIGSGGVVANVCMLDGSAVSSFCIANGNFNAIAVQLSTLNSNASGFVEVSSEHSSEKVTFIYGPTLQNSIPLPVQSVLSLNILGSVAIGNKIFGQIGRKFYSVCEVLLNNVSVTREDLIAEVVPVPECALANGTASLDSRPSNIILQSLSSSTSEETVTLFVTSSFSCSENSEKITKLFSVNCKHVIDGAGSPITSTPASAVQCVPTESLQLSVSEAVGVTVVVTFIVSVLIGLVVGVGVTYLIMRDNTHKKAVPTETTPQEQQPTHCPLYEEVTLVKEEIELNTNTAYGPVGQ